MPLDPNPKTDYKVGDKVVQPAAGAKGVGVVTFVMSWGLFVKFENSPMVCPLNFYEVEPVKDGAMQTNPFAGVIIPNPELSEAENRAALKMQHTHTVKVGETVMTLELCPKGTELYNAWLAAIETARTYDGQQVSTESVNLAAMAYFIHRNGGELKAQLPCPVCHPSN